jgi:predicted O-linked N-acetylglucosamine transferase (SPINDLY family)
MGATYQEQGKLDEAISCYRKALEINPGNAIARSNLIFSLQYDPKITGEMLLAECRQWEKRHGARQAPPPYENMPDPEKRLRVGYISADFRGHAAAFLLEPLLSSHDKTAVEVFCYAEVRRPDAFTERFQKCADYWTVTVGLADKELEATIRSDGIDILVDCGGYSSNNRLAALTGKPAPIQVSTMFGHGGATGLNIFDYVLTDSYLTPPGFDGHFVEKIIRLPHHVAPFRPLPQWPEVYPLQAAKTGRVVFGCFAAPARISSGAIALWHRVLQRVPGSHLLLKNPAFGDTETQRFWREAFLSFGNRVEFEDVPGGWGRNMDVYSRIDIVLDSFPVSGHTTSIIPLWMGVPVISFSGKHAAQRFGASVLSNAGLTDLLAKTGQEYVDKAVALANDVGRLIFLRTTLRERLALSPLCNARQITGEIEAAYRTIWRKWCESQAPKKEII